MKSSKPRPASWGGYPRVVQQSVAMHWRDSPFPFDIQSTVLPVGNRRSYGDSCVNNGGAVVDMCGLNRFMRFDDESGVLWCEAGVLLVDILDAFVPRGWFLPVTPGTKYATVAGAIANDVHGKNHHCAGTFGCFVECFELLRSDNTRLVCSQTDNSDWYEATIGGLGLTGIITWAAIRLKRVQSAYIEQEDIQYHHLKDFFDLADESETDFEYTVAWLDCLASGESLGRGVFSRGNHAEVIGERPVPKKTHLNIPFAPPISLVQPITLKAFNSFYFNTHKTKQFTVHYDPFFYPLDKIDNWNRVYGAKGFLQYQCVVPPENAYGSIAEILRCISTKGQGSFLAVLKKFGDIKSPGLLSFPRSGVTLALDFPLSGDEVFVLLDELDAIVAEAGGAVYPAKDARMQSRLFQEYFPGWQKLEEMRDPAISSSFWRRVTGESS